MIGNVLFCDLTPSWQLRALVGAVLILSFFQGWGGGTTAADAAQPHGGAARASEVHGPHVPH